MSDVDGSIGDQADGISRRSFLRWTATAASGVGLTALTAQPAWGSDDQHGCRGGDDDAIVEATIAQLQAAMQSGDLTASDLVEFYLDRIESLNEDGPTLRAILEVNPNAGDTARRLDQERRSGHVRSPLHGIAIVLKDNIDTTDMMTTAGSLALAGPRPHQDATLTQRLRDAGAIILGKANLSEWANFRSTRSCSGWSGRGRQGVNPYVLDRSPCGSSSGSAAAAAASLATATLGTETNGSIVCPSSVNGVVGIKPTVGLTSRAGVVPISHTQDTVGPHGRTVADAAAVLTVIASRTPDPNDPATAGVPLGWQGRFPRPALPVDYTQFLNPNGLAGARIGVTRQGIDNAPPQVVAAFDDAIASIHAAGATVVDLDGAGFLFPPATGEFLVLTFDFKLDLQKYFATRVGVPMANKTLADAIAFNNANAATEMPYFFQEIFELAELIDISSPDAPQ